MSDPKNYKKDLSSESYGTMLQMSRMIATKRRSVFDSPMSSDVDDEEETPPTSTNTKPPTDVLHSLQSLLQLKEQIEKATPKEPKKPRIPEREIPSLPTGSFGIDPGVLKMIYNMGYDAGLDKRDPIPPCEVCEERRRKNRIAAAEQRKRQREEQEEEQYRREK